jgi:predicted Zn-ribbon and HTH transcriptional regulator
MAEKVQLWGWRCERCGHEWLPRSKDTPRVCPKCKSPYWDKPRTKESGDEKAKESEDNTGKSKKKK